MLFRSHFVFGVFCWLVLGWVVEMPFFVLGGVLFGLMVVDLDSWNSKVGKRFWFLSWLFRHRGFLHSLVAGFLVSSLFGLVSLWFGFGVFVGYVSHLVLDCLTVNGVRLFWPLRVRVGGFVRSGGWVEDVVFVLLLVCDIVFGVYKFL